MCIETFRNNPTAVSVSHFLQCAINTASATPKYIISDKGLAKLTPDNRRDLLELLEDRHGARSIMAPSQLPIEILHDIIGNLTLADAILDRLVHNAYKVNLKEGSMRKRRE